MRFILPASLVLVAGLIPAVTSSVSQSSSVAFLSDGNVIAFFLTHFLLSHSKTLIPPHPPPPLKCNLRRPKSTTFVEICLCCLWFYMNFLWYVLIISNTQLRVLLAVWPCDRSVVYTHFFLKLFHLF